MATYVKRGTHWVLSTDESVVLGNEDTTGLLATEYESSKYKSYVKTQSGADLLDWYGKTPLFLLDEKDEVILKDDDTGILLHYGGGGLTKNPTAIAIYSEDDSSLTFYYVSGNKIPKEGIIYKNKVVTNVYTEFDTNIYSNSSSVPWYSHAEDILLVSFDSSFVNVKPISTAYWFNGFINCSSIDLMYLDTSKVTSMNHMFTNCDDVDVLDVSNWDTSNVVNMMSMFWGCENLITLDVSKWRTENVTNMYGVFSYCSSLISLDVSNFNTGSVTEMGSMFYLCTSLTSLDVSNWDTSKVTNMINMFSYCRYLTTIYSDDNNFVTSAVATDTSMFYTCTNLVGGNGTKYSSSKVDSSMAHIDTEGNPGYFTQK